MMTEESYKRLPSKIPDAWKLSRIVEVCAGAIDWAIEAAEEFGEAGAAREIYQALLAKRILCLVEDREMIGPEDASNLKRLQLLVETRKMEQGAARGRATEGGGES